VLYTKKSFIIIISIVLVILVLFSLNLFSKNKKLDTKDKLQSTQDEIVNCSEESDQVHADICYSNLASSNLDVDKCSNIVNDSLRLSCTEQINQIIQTMNSLIPGTR